MTVPSTRERLLEAACSILATEPLSHLSIDNVTQSAGVARRTFFLHFQSKDELLGEVLAHLRPLNLGRLKEWSASLAPGMEAEDRIRVFFDSAIAQSEHPQWRGDLFIRLSAEFAELSGHPVRRVVADAYRDTEAWFESELRKGGYELPAGKAAQLVVILSGLLVRQLIERSERNGAAARGLLADILATGKLR